MHIVSSGVSGALVSESSARPLSLVLLIGLASAAVHSPFQPAGCRHHSPGLSLLRPHQSALPPCAASGPGRGPGGRSCRRSPGRAPVVPDPRSAIPDPQLAPPAILPRRLASPPRRALDGLSLLPRVLFSVFSAWCAQVAPGPAAGRRGRRGPGPPSMPLPVVPKPDPRHTAVPTPGRVSL